MRLQKYPLQHKCFLSAGQTSQTFSFLFCPPGLLQNLSKNGAAGWWSFKMRSACCLCLIWTPNQVRPAGLSLPNMASAAVNYSVSKWTFLLPDMGCCGSAPVSRGIGMGCCCIQCLFACYGMHAHTYRTSVCRSCKDWLGACALQLRQNSFQAYAACSASCWPPSYHAAVAPSRSKYRPCSRYHNCIVNTNTLSILRVVCYAALPGLPLCDWVHDTFAFLSMLTYVSFCITQPHKKSSAVCWSALLAAAGAPSNHFFGRSSPWTVLARILACV